MGDLAAFKILDGAKFESFILPIWIVGRKESGVPGFGMLSSGGLSLWGIHWKVVE